MPEVILPGTYITVRDEGLITAGRVATGVVGIVGTAARGPVDEVVALGSFAEARAAFGEADPWQAGKQNELTLMRALELVFNNGGSTVYAVRAAARGVAKPATHAVKKGTATLLTLTARSPGSWANDVQVRISASREGEGSSAVDVRTLELINGPVREDFTAAGAEALARAINERSAMVTATLEAGAGAQLPDAVADTPRVTLLGGVNGEAAVRSDYERALELLENEIVNIVLLAGQDVSLADTLQGHLKRTEQMRRERMGVIGSNGTDSADVIAGHTLDSGRLVYVAPGLRVSSVDPATRRETEVNLPGAYTAAAVAGLISSLPVQASPTNKPLVIGGLSTAFNTPKLEKLVQKRVLAVEKREGWRVVKGITTSTNPAWAQITTRRIVDYAMYGVRSACSPYVGKLNNDRVRGAMKATIDGFLTRMVQDEALVSYQLEVSATRAQELAGECIVTMTLQPTFSIDYIMVTMYLS